LLHTHAHPHPSYEAPTPGDMWTDGLRVWIVECSSPGCGGSGVKRCTSCKQARYCAQGCQSAHWPANKADCKRVRAELAASENI
jgi:hypothetical protein